MPIRLRLNMNPRTKQLAAIGVLAVIVSFMIIFRAPKDDLDWIRRYGPLEQVRPGAVGTFGKERFATRWHTFRFKFIPAEFMAELRERSDYRAAGDSYHFNGTFPDTDRIMISKDLKTVEVWMHKKESWFEVGHRELRNFVCLR